MKFNSFIHLAINNPFRSIQKIEELIDAANFFNTDMVIPIQLEKNLFFQHTGNGLKPIGNHTDLRIERKQIYREVGSMRFYKINSLKKSNNKIGHILLSEPDNFDITESSNVNYIKKLEK